MEEHAGHEQHGPKHEREQHSHKQSQQHQRHLNFPWCYQQQRTEGWRRLWVLWEALRISRTTPRPKKAMRMRLAGFSNTCRLNVYWSRTAVGLTCRAEKTDLAYFHSRNKACPEKFRMAAAHKAAEMLAACRRLFLGSTNVQTFNIWSISWRYFYFCWVGWSYKSTVWAHVSCILKILKIVLAPLGQLRHASLMRWRVERQLVRMRRWRSTRVWSTWHVSSRKSTLMLWIFSPTNMDGPPTHENLMSICARCSPRLLCVCVCQTGGSCAT